MSLYLVLPFSPKTVTGFYMKSNTTFTITDSLPISLKTL